MKDSRCLESYIRCKASVSTHECKFVYIGCPANSFEILRNHMNTLKNPNLLNATSLSNLIWELKDEDRDYILGWEIICKNKSYKRSADYAM